MWSLSKHIVAQSKTVKNCCILILFTSQFRLNTFNLYFLRFYCTLHFFFSFLQQFVPPHCESAHLYVLDDNFKSFLSLACSIARRKHSNSTILPFFFCHFDLTYEMFKIAFEMSLLLEEQWALAAFHTPHTVVFVSSNYYFCCFLFDIQLVFNFINVIISFIVCWC